jgi:hypothetical protein
MNFAVVVVNGSLSLRIQDSASLAVESIFLVFAFFPFAVIPSLLGMNSRGTFVPGVIGNNG